MLFGAFNRTGGFLRRIHQGSRDRRRIDCRRFDRVRKNTIRQGMKQSGKAICQSKMTSRQRGWTAKKQSGKEASKEAKQKRSQPAKRQNKKETSQQGDKTEGKGRIENGYRKTNQAAAYE